MGLDIVGRFRRRLTVFTFTVPCTYNESDSGAHNLEDVRKADRTKN